MNPNPKTASVVRPVVLVYVSSGVLPIFADY
jgi:hypothetical protein